MQKCGGHDPALSELWCSASAGARDLRNKLVGWAQKLRRSRARFLARWASGASELPAVQGRAGACRGSRACASERAPVATRCGAACNAMRGRLQRDAGPPATRCGAACDARCPYGLLHAAQAREMRVGHAHPRRVHAGAAAFTDPRGPRKQEQAEIRALSGPAVGAWLRRSGNPLLQILSAGRGRSLGLRSPEQTTAGAFLVAGAFFTARQPAGAAALSASAAPPAHARE
jgi:hypothetical protein